jgi:predicted nucleic acid-binding protein
MRRLCLDTSAYSRFRRGDRRTIELIDSAAWVGIPAIVLGELRPGFGLGAQRDRNEGMLHEFLANPGVSVVDVDDEVASHDADIVMDLRREGHPIPTNDIWIAATAARVGAFLLTSDSHFTAIARVGSILLAHGAG